MCAKKSLAATADFLVGLKGCLPPSAILNPGMTQLQKRPEVYNIFIYLSFKLRKLSISDLDIVVYLRTQNNFKKTMQIPL
jgi:hypothetical protein